MKVCFECSIKKPLCEFYTHKKSKDGHVNKCKDCTKKDVHANRLKNIEKIREYDRNRPNKAERLGLRQQEHIGAPTLKGIMQTQQSIMLLEMAGLLDQMNVHAAVKNASHMGIIMTIQSH